MAAFVLQTRRIGAAGRKKRSLEPAASLARRQTSYPASRHPNFLSVTESGGAGTKNVRNDNAMYNAAYYRNARVRLLWK